MSHTGHYVWCKEQRKLVKVSDDIPKATGLAFSTDASSVHKPYWDEHIADDGPVYITSRAQKARLLKENGLSQKRFGKERDLF